MGSRWFSAATTDSIASRFFGRLCGLGEGGEQKKGAPAQEAAYGVQAIAARERSLRAVKIALGRRIEKLVIRR